MTIYVFYTAASLDGYLADEHDGLDWLLSQPVSAGGILDYERFVAGVGAVVLGRSTYDWLADQGEVGPGRWSYERPSFLFTHRGVEPPVEHLRVLSGDPAAHRAALEEAAGEGEVWILGGGDLATAFARAGMLDRIDLTYAPVTLGAGKPLATAGLDMELIETGRSGPFLEARYAVHGLREQG